MSHAVAIGFHAFVADSTEEFGAIRDVSANGREITVYVENAGDFVVPVDSVISVISVQSEKVTFDCAKLDAKLRRAIGHAHDNEQPGV